MTQPAAPLIGCVRDVLSMCRRSVRSVAMLVTLVGTSIPAAHADPLATVERIKGSVLAVGTFERTRSPAFVFRGTGFVIADGSLVATNAHVLPTALDGERRETLVVALPGPNVTTAQLRTARIVASERANDLAILAIDGPKLQPLSLGESVRVREGQAVYFTGYPIGTVLGLIPATHRAMIAALTPIALPSIDASQLDAQAIRRLSGASEPVMQLDGTAYPGNSGSPLYDPETGQVVGIVNSTLVKASRETLLSQPSGIAYALPVRWLLDLLKTVR